MSIFKDLQYRCKSTSFRKIYPYLTLNQFITYYNEFLISRLGILKDPTGLFISQDLYYTSEWLLINNLVEVDPKSPSYTAHNTIFKLIKEKVSTNIPTEIIPEIPIPTNSSTDYDKLIEVSSKYLKLLKSAKARNKEFNLTLSDVAKLLERKTCYYSKRPFIDGDDKYHRTIDRKDHNKGYVKGNVVACTNQMNQLKNLLLESESESTKLYRLDIKDIVNFALKMQSDRK